MPLLLIQRCLYSLLILLSSSLLSAYSPCVKKNSSKQFRRFQNAGHTFARRTTHVACVTHANTTTHTPTATNKFKVCFIEINLLSFIRKNWLINFSHHTVAMSRLWKPTSSPVNIQCRVRPARRRIIHPQK